MQEFNQQTMSILENIINPHALITWKKRMDGIKYKQYEYYDYFYEIRLMESIVNQKKLSVSEAEELVKYLKCYVSNNSIDNINMLTHLQRNDNCNLGSEMSQFSKKLFKKSYSPYKKRKRKELRMKRKGLKRS